MQISLRTTGTRLNAKRPVSVADRGGRSSGNDRLLNISQALSVKPAQNREIRRMHDSGDYNIVQIAALFSTSRPTVYRSLDRTAELPPLSRRHPARARRHQVRPAAHPQPRTTVTARDRRACANDWTPTRHPPPVREVSFKTTGGVLENIP